MLTPLMARSLFLVAVLVSGFAGCGRPSHLEGVYVGPAPSGPTPPGVTGSAAVKRPWLVFDRAGRVSRRLPQSVADLDPAHLTRNGYGNVGTYEMRGGQLTLDWGSGREQHAIAVARDHLDIDGGRWQRLDGRAADVPLTGRYQWTSTVPGIVSEVSEISFGAKGEYASERRVTRFTPPTEPEVTRRTGTYRRDGSLLRLSFDDGKTATVTFFVELVEGGRVLGLWQAGIPFGRVAEQP